MKVVYVVLKKSTKAFEQLYSYVVSDDMASSLQEGTSVMVPFGVHNRAVEAFVKKIIDSSAYDDAYPIDKLKSVLSVKSTSRKLNQEQLALVSWMSKKYFCTESAALRLMSPPGGEQIDDKKERTIKLKLTATELEQLVDNGIVKKIHQIEILRYLKEAGETTIEEMKNRFSVTTAVLDTLRKHDYVSYGERRKQAVLQQDAEIPYYAPPKALTTEQQEASNTLKAALQAGKMQEFLLHGVTGSGKTEVYLSVIEEVLRQGKQAIVLVPEISLTPQMQARFQGRFGSGVVMLHSKLTDRQRYEHWQAIRRGEVNLVVGARSAVFAPFAKLGAIFIDEEHETSYESDKTPKYHAADIAKFRCDYHKALLVYGSATPSITTSYRVQKKEIGYLKLAQRATGIQLPQVTLVDMKQEYENGNKGIFSDALYQALEENLRKKEQSMLLLNKRGYSHGVICKTCGYTQKCPSCDVTMTYHASNERVICHYCGYTEKAVHACPSCQSTELKQSGVGTQQVERQLQKMFPEAKILRMDMDTTKGRLSHAELLKQFAQGDADILIGTQMIAKGHDFPKVTLMGILAADAGLYLEDYLASERTFQLITQAAGRAGRGTLPGKVIIQAQNIDDYTIQAAAKQDYRYFYTRETLIRRQLDFPPFTNLAIVGMNGKEDKKVYDAMADVKQRFLQELTKNNWTGIQVLGPARYPLSKMNGKYRWRLLLKGKDQALLEQLCSNVLAGIPNKTYSEMNGPGVEVNPRNLL